MPMKNEDKTSVIDAWKQTRSGAWAGRGFHFQHLFSTLILIRQWAGLSPSGNLVPEGLEDCVVELPSEEFWIQVKSRKEGGFSEGEVNKILKEVTGKESNVQNTGNRKVILVLERPCPSRKCETIDGIFKGCDEQILVCTNPHDEILRILIGQFEIVGIIAEGILSDLYKLVASASEDNAHLSFENRRRISTTEVERRIFERLEAEDPSAIDYALSSGILEPIEFSKPVSEPAFYQGVKSSPGHVTAGLVLNRPEEKNHVISLLKKRRHALLSGQSGAGKSALMWLAINDLAGSMRWYQVTSCAAASDADSIIRFLRARRPSEVSPIGLALDEIGAIGADLWNILARELRGMSDIYFLGTVRKEDISFISNHSDVEIIEVSLNEKLAESVWSELQVVGQTQWKHWREAFEMSNGLMLEYVHILTQGKRLAVVINDQIRIRQQESRYNELAILRVVATIFSLGGDIQASKLIDLIGINSNEASAALRHLLDEHLIRESKPGVLGGLHILRSKALVEATHDQVLFVSSESFWKGLLAVTNDTLPSVIQSILADISTDEELVILKNLSELLDNTKDIEVWVAILTGLGLATLERNVVTFINALERNGVQRGQWAFASMFGDSTIDISWLIEMEPLRIIGDAVNSFRELPKQDLRQVCLEQRSKGKLIPSCNNFQQANKLLSCLAPICGGDPIDIEVSAPAIENEELDINVVSRFLASAYFISPDLAKRLVDELGGEEFLFDLFISQTPWVTFPEIDFNGKHGRTVRADIFFVSDNVIMNSNKRLCDVCETLIAISPKSDAAASDIVTPVNKKITVSGHSYWSKNMPRSSMPSKTRISWNVAFRQILLARSASESLTEYANEMAALIRRTEKIFRLYSEKWIRGKRISKAEVLAVEVNEIITAVNNIAYTAPEQVSSDMTEPALNSSQDDSLGALLTGILGNLMGRMNQLSSDGKPKGTAVFAGSLARQAFEHEQSLVWRMSLSPPKKELVALAERLMQVSHLLHEFAFDTSDFAQQKIINFTSKSGPSKAVSTAEKRCQLLANQRFDKKLKSVEADLNAKGWSSQCLMISIDELDCVYWPAREVTILIYINNLEAGLEYQEAAFQSAEKYLKNDCRYRVVPVINGFVIPSLAMLPSSHTPLPDHDFLKEWKDHITVPFMFSQAIEEFDKALGACIQISGMLACCDLEKLHPEEEKALNDAIKLFKQSNNFIIDAAERTEADHILWASDCINQYWNSVIEELEAVQQGQGIKHPICIIDHEAIGGQFDDDMIERAAGRMFMMEAECFSGET